MNDIVLIALFVAGSIITCLFAYTKLTDRPVAEHTSLYIAQQESVYRQAAQYTEINRKLDLILNTITNTANPITTRKD